MKLIIAGSRSLELNYEALMHLMLSMVGNPKEIVNGYCATGVDKVAREMCREHKWNIKYFPADWETHGKAAGPIRNKEMAEYADALLLIWDGESRGSANMKDNMLKLGKPVYEVVLRRHNEKLRQCF